MKQTAAHYAARNGNIECLQALVTYNADFTVLDKNLDSVMHVCAQEGQAKAAKFLAQRGINPMTKNKKGKSPKMTAKDCGKKLVLKELSRAEKNWSKYHEGNET